jgi:hypothetical protein
LKKYTHINKEKEKKLETQDSEEKKTPCKFGAACYLTNPLHLAKYSHPESKDEEEV